MPFLVAENRAITGGVRMVWLAFIWLAVGSIVAVVFGLVARVSQESSSLDMHEVVATQDPVITPH